MVGRFKSVGIEILSFKLKFNGGSSSGKFSSREILPPFMGALFLTSILLQYSNALNVISLHSPSTQLSADEPTSSPRRGLRVESADVKRHNLFLRSFLPNTRVQVREAQAELRAKTFRDFRIPRRILKMRSERKRRDGQEERFPSHNLRTFDAELSVDTLNFHVCCCIH